MLEYAISTLNGQVTLLVESNQTAPVEPPPPPPDDPIPDPVTTYTWQVYSASSGNDVGSPFTTVDNRTAEQVFNAAISSANGNAALQTESGFVVPAQTYDYNTGNHVLYSHGSAKFLAGADLPSDGVGFDGSFIPTIGISFQINGGGTRNAGIRCTSVITT